jgi:protease IV
MTHTATHTPKRGLIRRFFSALGGAITWARTTSLNILFLLIVVMIFAAIGSNSPAPLGDSFALNIEPKGMLVDQRSFMDPTSLLLSDDNPEDNETLVRELVDAIKQASDDARVTSILLQPGHLAGGGISKLTELGQALEAFKSSGKKIIAISDSYTQDQYYLASFADEIYLHEMGDISITGYARFSNYYKTALDNLGVTVHAFRSGKYKDYLEPYLRDNMSDASREHNAQWLGELWQSYSAQIETARKLPAGSLTDLVNNLDALMALSDGDGAKLALEKGLVDHLGSRQLMAKMLEEKHMDESVSAQDYIHSKQHKKRPKNDQVGLLVAAGTISDGHQEDGAIGGESMAELVHSIKDMPNIKALVIRVDSGGGSAFASEIIRAEIVALKEKNIPIFISMGSVAASGGYWIATAGDQIWAQPTTITGSIGVFGAFPTLEKTLGKIGINTDGLGTTQLAGDMRIDRPLSPQAGKIVQLGVDNIYQRFLKLVSEARAQTPEQIDAVAQGHVWTGAKAQSLGLVDHLGTLDEVIAAAAAEAKLTDYDVKLIATKLSPKQEFIRQLTEGNASSLLPKVLLEKFAALTLLNETLAPLNNLQKMNDPQGIYLQCLSCVAP